MQYKELRKINVSQYIEKKNGLSYLSWSWALDQLLQLDNDLYRTMNALQKYRDNKAKLIDGELVNDGSDIEEAA